MRNYLLIIRATKNVWTILETTCASELKKVYSPMGRKRCNYWRDDEISKLRKEMTKSRRKAQRVRTRGMNDATHLSELELELFFINLWECSFYEI